MGRWCEKEGHYFEFWLKCEKCEVERSFKVYMKCKAPDNDWKSKKWVGCRRCCKDVGDAQLMFLFCDEGRCDIDVYSFRSGMMRYRVDLYVKNIDKELQP